MPRVFLADSPFPSSSGDVLVVSNATFAQGVEVPFENSTTYDSTCGQPTTYPFFMTYNDNAPPQPTPPPGNNESLPFNVDYETWNLTWSYRRAYSPVGDPSAWVNLGDTSQQNIAGGNDLDSGYIFISMDESKASAAAGSWMGGINLTTLSDAEQRSYG